MNVSKNRVLEWQVVSEKNYQNPFRDVQVDAVITGPDGYRAKLPAFWQGNGKWGFRFSSSKAGAYQWQAVCSDPENTDILKYAGSFQVVENPEEQNPLYLHGRLRTSEDGHCFLQQDGTPFFALIDNWSQFLCHRISFSFLEKIIEDRREKGFNMVMLSAGEMPDIMPFDDRAESDAGFPWDQDFTTIRPEYYDAADKRIVRIIDGQLMPLIVGTWGHLMQFADEEFLRLFLRNIVARYAAYPVLFCAAGETTMQLHGDFRKGPEANYPIRNQLFSYQSWKGHGLKARGLWGKLTQYMRQVNPFPTLISNTPSSVGYPFPYTSSAQMEDPSILDYEMIFDWNAANTPARCQKAYAAARPMPVIEYNPTDGMYGNPGTQNAMFWTTVMNGARGVMYSSGGVLVANDLENFGPSGHGCTWVFESAEQSMQAAGSRTIGHCKALLETLDWTSMTARPEWVVSPTPEAYERKDAMAAGAPSSPILAAGTARGQRIFFIPGYLTREGNLAKKPRLRIGDKPVRVKAIALGSGVEVDYGVAFPDKKGEWILHKKNYYYQPVFSDMLVIVDPDLPLGELKQVYAPEDALDLPWEDDEVLLRVNKYNGFMTAEDMAHLAEDAEIFGS